MSESSKSIERLFPFVKRARALIVGQHVLLRSKSQLHFILLTHDISDRGKSEALRKFKHYPIVQHYRSADLAAHFDVQGVKLMGFRKSGLSKSIYAGLKRYRINEPVVRRRSEDDPSVPANRGKPAPRKSADRKNVRSTGKRSSARSYPAAKKSRRVSRTSRP